MEPLGNAESIRKFVFRTKEFKDGRGSGSSIVLRTLQKTKTMQTEHSCSRVRQAAAIVGQQDEQLPKPSQTVAT